MFTTSLSSAESSGAVVSYWRKYVHEVLVNRLGGLSLPRKSGARLTDRPDMTLDVYRGRKTTTTINSHCNLARFQIDQCCRNLLSSESVTVGFEV